MLQRDVLQFYERGWADAETLVSVGQAPNGTTVQMPAVTPRDDGEAPWVVGRVELWGAALRLIQTRPLLGVGPDNFRHLYGAQLGLETWDERVQANNLYLEVLADVGLLGLAAFLWAVGGPLVVARRLLTARFARSLSSDEKSSDQLGFDSRMVMILGLTLGVVAFLVHGLFDSFLAFTPTALLLWLLLGMLLAQKPQVSGR
jgi:putative inorganic carbon (HCO3(-)) transporter